MKNFFIEQKNFPKIILTIIAVVSIFSISLTCFIVSEVISQNDEEIIKVIVSDVHDDINNELLKNVAIAQSMANDLFLHENLRTENTRTEKEQTEFMKKYLTLMRDRVKCSSAFLASNNSKNYWQATGLIKKLNLEKDPHDAWYSNILKEPAKEIKSILKNDLGISADISLGWDGTGIGSDPNTYREISTGRSLSNSEVLYRLSQAEKHF